MYLLYKTFEFKAHFIDRLHGSPSLYDRDQGRKGKMMGQQVPPRLLLLILLLFAASSVLSDDCPEKIFEHGTNSEGGTEIPVFHRNHPCLRGRSLGAKSARGEGEKIVAMDVIEDSSLNKFLFLIPIKLGDPPVMNLVAFDTGSTLSWVQCQPCTVRCHQQSKKAGLIFDPIKSTAHRRVACESTDCKAIRETLLTLPLDVPNCMEKEDSCLYAMTYGGGSSYTVGKVGRERLEIGKDPPIVIRDLLLGCSLDVKYPLGGLEAGVAGFGSNSFSFFEQVATEMSYYKAFSYCLPSDEASKGYLVLGDYNRKEAAADAATTLFFPRPGAKPAYSLIMNNLLVADHTRSLVTIRAKSVMMVDSGSRWTFLEPQIFHRLREVITQKILASSSLDYLLSNFSGRGPDFTCFILRKDSENSNWNGRHTPFNNWSSLPVVQIGFIGTVALSLPPQNSFHFDSRYGLCMNFVKGGPSKPPLLGNRVTRSFRTIFDIDKRQFRFRPGAC